MRTDGHLCDRTDRHERILPLGCVALIGMDAVTIYSVYIREINKRDSALLKRVQRGRAWLELAASRNGLALAAAVVGVTVAAVDTRDCSISLIGRI